VSLNNPLHDNFFANGGVAISFSSAMVRGAVDAIRYRRDISPALRAELVALLRDAADVLEGF
jgi:hypothetical protein